MPKSRSASLRRPGRPRPTGPRPRDGTARWTDMSVSGDARARWNLAGDRSCGVAVGRGAARQRVHSASADGSALHRARGRMSMRPLSVASISAANMPSPAALSGPDQQARCSSPVSGCLSCPSRRTRRRRRPMRGSSRTCHSSSRSDRTGSNGTSQLAPSGSSGNAKSPSAPSVRRKRVGGSPRTHVHQRPLPAPRGSRPLVT